MSASDMAFEELRKRALERWLDLAGALLTSIGSSSTPTVAGGLAR